MGHVGTAVRAGAGALVGVAVEPRECHVWTLRDGKVWRLRIYATKSEALEAVGLSEQDALRIKVGGVQTASSIREQIDALGPWCHELEVTDGISTREWHERNPGSDIAFLDPKSTKVSMMLRRVYRRDLAGRSVLDCGCNAGGYLFLARELGAGHCHGFDVRQHWIDQARFVAAARDEKEITFEVCDLYDLRVEPFDVTLFNGLFYHLPDPIRGLKIAADLTREVMFVDTSTRAGVQDGYLAMETESTDILVSGVYGLNWLPTGPVVVERILEWAGFVEWRVIGYRNIRHDVNRLAMVASKVRGQLDGIPDFRTSMRDDALEAVGLSKQDAHTDT